jgi:hypothetical protein
MCLTSLNHKNDDQISLSNLLTTLPVRIVFLRGAADCRKLAALAA